MNRNRYRRIVLMSGVTAPPAPSPFGGSYDWWLNPINAVTSGGAPYVDSVQLTGNADYFEQPTAANRPIYNAVDFDGNPSFQNDGTNLRIFKHTDANVFSGGVGTFEFLANLSAGETLFTEVTATPSNWNFQLYILATNLSIYTDADGAKTLGAYTLSENAVHTFTLSGASFKYYKNGVLINTVTINQAMVTPRPLTMFGYKNSTSEQGTGKMYDVIRASDAKLAADITANYNDFWKAKYPSLP